MRNVFFFGFLLFIFACWPKSPTKAQEYPSYIPTSQCLFAENKDSWSLTPHEEFENTYVFTFYNNRNHCSTNQNVDVSSSDGFTVTMQLRTDYGSIDQSQEHIYIIPEDSTWIAVPAEMFLRDGETGNILIIQGIM